MKKYIASMALVFCAVATAEVPIEYSWTQYESRKYLGNNRYTICYLQGMVGRFEGKHEIVNVSTSLPDFNGFGYYHLGGRSNQNDVGGWARCLNKPGHRYDDRRFHWDQTYTAPVYLRTARDHVCYINGVEGDFEGPGEEIIVYRVGDNWRIRGRSNQKFVTAHPRCTKVKPGYWSRTYHWEQGQSGVVMSDVNSTICMLQRVRGKFKGYAEYIRITTRNGRYVLGGGSRQVGVAASAICIKQDSIGV
ncbi:hypothetical protein FKG94_01320 [Exilibacterium tricleocarpae]|uniref:Uncharacterized protein n=1 Tax=Exilibacterium tricleocarpae TaxID=2591008 RepID=A0A545U9S8_9GAMM|nr:hypothetical protein [Exilibacterium tricleocarpae]TQV86220.1 hypothetical protein FKG94_01320 [Exilibacterium tricleocarpae]